MAGPGEIFTLFFVTLGPLKILGPFAAQTQDLEPALRRGIALRVFVLGLGVLIVGGWVGRTLAMSWTISHSALLIATGVIFFVVALNLVVEQYVPPNPVALAPLPARPLAAALQLTFPMVVTPYGVAGVVAVLSATPDNARIEMIFPLGAVVMVLNLLAMLSARPFTQGAMGMDLRVLGGDTGVLQVALAVEIIIRGPQELEIVK